MLGEFAAVVLVISFAAIDVIWKRLRMRDVSTKAILALFGFSVPLLILLGILFADAREVVLSGDYVAYSLLFVVGNLFLNLANVYLMRYVSLTELFSYRKSIALFFAILADIFFFSLFPTTFRILGIGLLFLGSMLLTRSARETTKKCLIPMATLLIYLILIGFLDTGLFTVYKKGLELQSSIILHMVLVQSVMFLLFLAVGWRDLRSSFGKIRAKEIAALNILVTIGAIAEIYTLHYYSISAIVLISGIPLGIFSLYDVRTKEWRLTPKSIVSILLIVIGFVLLNA